MTVLRLVESRADKFGVEESGTIKVAIKKRFVMNL